MRWLSIAVAALSAACSDGARDHPSTVLRDSAGVRIATTDARGVPGAASYSSVGAPSLRIGGPSDSASYDGDLFRVASARILDDNRIAVLQGDHELRLYGPEGLLEAVVGGRGEGPGEFLLATDLQELPDGSLAVWDASLGRLSLFSSEAQFVRSIRLDLDRFALRFPSVLQIRPESRWRLIDERALLVFDYSFDGMPDEGPGRPTVSYVVIDLDGERADTLGSYGGIEQTRLPNPSRAVVAALDADDTHVALDEGAGRIYVADGGLDHIDRFDASGRLDLRIVLREVDRSPDPSRMEAAGRRAIEDLERRGVSVPQGAIEDLASGDRAPAFRGLAPDDQGQLWVRWGQQPNSAVALYAVFDAECRFLGSVSLPDHDRILHIARGRIVLLQRSSLDVETIAVHELVVEAG